MNDVITFSLGDAVFAYSQAVAYRSWLLSLKRRASCDVTLKRCLRSVNFTVADFNPSDSEEAVWRVDFDYE